MDHPAGLFVAPVIDLFSGIHDIEGVATVDRVECLLLDLWNEIQADVPGIKRIKQDGKPDTVLSIARLARAIVNDNPQASIDVRDSRFGLIPVSMIRGIPERQLPFCRSGFLPLRLKL